MIDDMIIVDGVVHCYNWSLENQRALEAGIFQKGGYGYHQMLSKDDESRLPFDTYCTNWQPDELEALLIRETPIDMACYHGTPIYDYFYDGHTAFEKGIPMQEKHPERIRLYYPVNPFETHDAIEAIERVKEEHNIAGLKLYAASYYRGRTLPIRVDDPLFGEPLVECAIELGIKSIAVHKALPFGPTGMSAFHDVTDIDAVALKYPEMNFEVVHSGYAFLEETAFLLERHSNVWANLEVTASLVVNYPERFAQIMSMFLDRGAEDRLILATGSTLIHPLPTIEGIIDFEMAEGQIENARVPFGREQKRKMLGENFLRLHDIDPDDFRRKVAGDDWEQSRPEQLEKPWSAALEVRAGATAGA